MFKRHVYTCPDVIHVRKLQKRVSYTILGVEALFFGTMWAAMARETKTQLKNENPLYDK